MFWSSYREDRKEPVGFDRPSCISMSIKASETVRGMLSELMLTCDDRWPLICCFELRSYVESELWYWALLADIRLPAKCCWAKGLS